ncbi:MAG: hypothetical protein HQL73_11005, partial [Magnetococcales bacterium]|nr:hypothetical protein [Magnetococcales bacterium]
KKEPGKSLFSVENKKEEELRVDSDRRFKKFRENIVQALCKSATATHALEDAVSIPTDPGVIDRVGTLVERLIGLDFDVGVEVMRNVYATLDRQNDTAGVAAIKETGRFLIPWLYVSDRITNYQWDSVSLGDVVKIPAGLSTFAEIVMAGIDNREVIWNQLKDKMDFPDGAFGSRNLQFQPEGGISVDREKALREDLFKIVKSPREVMELDDTQKDRAIAQRLRWWFMERGIRIYLIAWMPNIIEEQPEYREFLKRIQQRYPALAIITLDRDLVIENQELFDSIRDILM